MGKKKRKYSTVKVINMEEVYRLLNRVQVNKKEVTFALSPEEAIIADNVIKDLELEYNRKERKTKIVYTIYPDPDSQVENTELDIDIDFFDDEILEDGQLF